MEHFNNLYNFKNPIRHFFNLDQLSFNSVRDLRFNQLAWTKPVDFRIFKTENTYRTLGLPNILNFYHAIRHFEGEGDFYAISRRSTRKRVAPNVSLGEFSVLSYDRALQNDLCHLTMYDKLLLMDIKSFYGRIYTHDLGYLNDGERCLEQRATSLNAGRTNGILLGSYLSLYLAEKMLSKIEALLCENLGKANISCHFEYFSDDFYFFCMEKDVLNIQTVFAETLSAFQLEPNEQKTAILDFDAYSKENNLDKQWKKIIKISEAKDREPLQQFVRPAFFTQLVYRSGNISELKYKRIFLANFFKTYYFHRIRPQRYLLSKSDLNHMCYIYKTMPECMLYSLNKIKEMRRVPSQEDQPWSFADFVAHRLRASLDTNRQEDQLYFYYAAKLCGYSALLRALKNEVLHSENQVLISYYILDGMIEKEECAGFLTEEKYWLINYHYVLQYDREQVDILIPEKAQGKSAAESYRSFYTENLQRGIPLLRPIEQVAEAVEVYIRKRIASFPRSSRQQ